MFEGDVTQEDADRIVAEISENIAEKTGDPCVVVPL